MQRCWWWSLQFSHVRCSWHTYSRLTCAVFWLLGILDATYMKAILVDGFLSKMTSGELDLWKVKHGRSMNESLRQFVIEYVGEPIQRALRWDNNWLTDLNPRHSARGVVGHHRLEKGLVLVKSPFKTNSGQFHSRRWLSPRLSTR